MSFPTGWTRSCALVVQHGQVTADQTAFPVLITEACLPAEMLTTGDPNAAQSDGGDIRFSSDSLGASQLACEVVGWTQNANPLLATAEIWVPRDILTASDVTIYVWYAGGGGLSQPAAGASYGSQAVWDSNYSAVYHLIEATNAQALDSTSNAYHSTANVATQAAGKIGNGQSFAAASTNYLQFGTPQPFTTFTISAWIKATAANYCSIWDWREWSGSGGAPGVGTVLYSDSTGKLIFFNTNGAGESITSTANVTDTTWHYAVATLASGTGKSYVDANAAVSGSFAADRASGNYGRISRTFNNLYSNQTIDEVRISIIARSATWISTEYANQNAPSAFVVAGTPGTPSGGSAIIPLAMNHYRQLRNRN